MKKQQHEFSVLIRILQFTEKKNTENYNEKREEGKRRREDEHTLCRRPHTIDTCFYNNLLYNYDKHHSQSKYNNQNLCLVKKYIRKNLKQKT